MSEASLNRKNAFYKSGLEEKRRGSVKVKQSPASESQKSVLPDVSHEGSVEVGGALHRVGMESIEMPLLLRDPTGTVFRQAASLDAYVSLDKPESKGIHMSRLYLKLKKTLSQEVFDMATLKQLLEDFVQTQDGLSQRSYLRVKYRLMVERPALISQESGWREYPVVVEGQLEEGEFNVIVGGQVMYSSTCPCSAALSRQLMQEQFLKSFAARGMVSVTEVAEWLLQESSHVATPHAQRSSADFRVKWSPGIPMPEPIELIDQVEKALKTPVQAAVKRQDEQEFARLNAANLMFCEDAGRRVRQAFEEDSRVFDYWIHVQHMESLHPHNASSVVVKGLPEGFQADSF